MGFMNQNRKENTKGFIIIQFAQTQQDIKLELIQANSLAQVHGKEMVLINFFNDNNDRTIQTSYINIYNSKHGKMVGLLDSYAYVHETVEGNYTPGR